MSEYIKLKDLTDTDCILIDEIECDDCPFYDKERFWCRVLDWINSLPTIEVSEDCIDRYTVLAELDPRSVEYKIIKDLPSVAPQTEKG